MGFDRIISIHGVPRSGTSWLGQILDSSPKVRYKFQPLFSYAFKNYINLESTKNELMTYYTQLYNYEDDFLDQRDKKIKGVYPEFEIKNDIPDILVTKMVRYHYLIPHLLYKLDNIKIIGIVRHPCGVLNSWKNAPKEFLDDWDFKEEWRFAQSMNKFNPEQYYGFNKWKETSKLFLEMKKNYPDKIYIIQYEDLVNNPIKISKKLFNFMELNWNKQTENFIHNSTSITQKNEYSVYKGKKDTKKWEKSLDKNIINTIATELKNTVLEKFSK